MSMPDARAPRTPEPPADVEFDARRTDALAVLAAGISHDLANPLAAIVAFASYLASDPRLPADLKDDAQLLRAEAEKTHRMVGTLLEFARNRSSSLAPVRIGAVVDEVLELESYVLADVHVERSVPDDLEPLAIDPSRLRHLLLVLSVEAIRRLGDRPVTGRLRLAARPGDGCVDVSLTYERSPGRAAIEGGSIPSATAAAEALGGSLRTEETARGGVFELSLPTEDDEAAIPMVLPARQAPVVSAGGGSDAAGATGPATTADDDASPTVLVCDDEDSIRVLLVRILERAGFGTLQAANGQEALSLLGSARVDVVLTDHHMLGMSGIELFEQATAERPDLRSRFVVMTGEPQAEDLVRFAGDAGITILAKPFETQTIAARIREIAKT